MLKLSQFFNLPDWTQDAACADADPEIFFPERGRSAAAARAVCAACPVTSECLKYAMQHVDARAFGVWGGTSPRERKGLKKRLPAAS